MALPDLNWNNDGVFMQGSFQQHTQTFMKPIDWTLMLHTNINILKKSQKIIKKANIILKLLLLENVNIK